MWFFDHPKPDVPKDSHAATPAALGDIHPHAAVHHTYHPPSPELKAKVMADAQAQAAQERYRRLSWGAQQRRDSNPLSKGINP